MTVYLVGAGPGDADLLTVRAARLLASADVVVHDRLVEGSVLELARPDAELIDVGKAPGRFTSQSMINDLLVSLGRRYEIGGPTEGRRSVRLRSRRRRDDRAARRRRRD